MGSLLRYCFGAILLAHAIKAFYVPGVSPVEFRIGQLIDVKAVKMTSSITQLPYEYYSLKFCPPKNGTLTYKSENLGEVLRGDRIVNTPYEIRMATNQGCQLLCGPQKWQKDESALVAQRVRHEYYVHLLVDNLPCATNLNQNVDFPQYEQGYRLGGIDAEKPFVNNHLKLVLHYHKDASAETYRVVRFEVQPYSVAFESLSTTENGCSFDISQAKKQYVNPNAETQLYFTYEVEWRESEIRWASRWDIYLAMPDTQVHWFSIVNSVVIVIFLSGIIAVIIVRTLRRDIARYNRDDESDDALEESGWKLVHGDVFRPPSYPLLFVAIVGSGLQIFCMTFITIFFAMMGMLSPASRGALMQAAILLYVFMGAFAGYFGARLYRTLRGQQWRKAAFYTSTFYPAIVFGTCFFLNFFIWGKHSSGAVPFGTMIWLLVLWFGISVPLVYVGFYFGFRKYPYEHPVRTNQIPRQIPAQDWYMHPVFCALMAGVLPFGSMFIELFFIFNALWENRFYYLFGFLFLVLILLIISVSQIAIVMVYFQLCSEDYRWWWRSLWVSGGSALYVFAYSFYYYLTKLEINEFIPTLLYFGYTGIMVVTFWLLTGCIGFYASYTFLRKIYSAVKIE